MKFNPPTPVFRIFNEAKAKEFYVDFLEFRIDWEHRFSDNAPLYMQITKGDCVIHLSEHYGDCSPGVSVRIESPDVVEYHKFLKSKKYKYANPGIGRQPWAKAEMCIQDPFGNKLIFFEASD